jgi:protein-L-isoaspartate O-methyltransferase
MPAPAQIKDARVAAAMKAVDRAAYCSSSPYVDSPQRIGFGATSARDWLPPCHPATLPRSAATA